MVWGTFAYRAAVSALACTVLLTIVMGLTHHGLENRLIFWPVEVDGWMIYQYGYDTQKGAESQTSVLELVSDPQQLLNS